VNLPISDIGYYVATLIICTVVHELGHAIAAVRYDVYTWYLCTQHEGKSID
jgi:S2P endopeptidase